MKRVWFAGSKDILRIGPFASDVLAWDALRVSATTKKWFGLIHAPGAYVWCELEKRPSAAKKPAQ